MFPEHWKLTENPFRISPDPDHIFATSGGAQARRQLMAAISAGAGLTLLTGAAGTGKTVLLRKLQRDLEARSRRVFLAYRPSETISDLLSRCCRDLGIALPSDGAPLPVAAMADRIAAAGDGRPVVCLIDEAQHLSEATLADLVRLSAPPPGCGRVAQFVLVGLPDIAARLDALADEDEDGEGEGAHADRRPDLPHVAMPPLKPAEIGPFIRHHLTQAGYRGPELFGAEACDAIADQANGSPRLVAQLAGHALLLAGLDGADSVTAAHVARAAGETLLPATPAQEDEAADPSVPPRRRLVDLVDLNPPPRRPDATPAPTATKPDPVIAPAAPAVPPPPRRPIAPPARRVAWLPRLLPPLRPGHIMLGLVIGIGATAVGADLDRAERSPLPDRIVGEAQSPSLTPAGLPAAPMRPDADLRAAALDAEQDENFAASIDRYRAVYDRDRTDLNALLGLARSLRHMGRPAEARGLVDAARADFADTPPLLVELAKAELAVGAPERAIDALRLAAERTPADWQVFALLGSAYDGLERRSDAAKSYRQALRLAPDNPVVLNNYGLSLARSGRLDGAVALLQHAAAQPAAAELVADNLMIVRAMQDRRAAAEESLRRDLLGQATVDGPARRIGETAFRPMAPPPRPVAPLILANGVDAGTVLAAATPAQVAVAPELRVADAAGIEDQPVPLDIAVPSADAAAAPVIEIAGLPPGAALSAGRATDDGRWRLSVADLAGLLLMPPADFSGAIDLDVAARPASAGDASLTTTRPLRVVLAASADDPLLVVGDANGLEDQNVALAIAADVADPDGSERLTVTVAGLPDGARLSAGEAMGDGRWRLTVAQLAGLALVPPPSYGGVIELAVAATAIEADGDTATLVEIVKVDIAGVPDVPILRADAATGLEDQPVPLTISAAAADPDGSERLTVTVAGLPDGATLSAGAAGGDGRWLLAPDDLAGLRLIPPAHGSGTFALDVIATAVEAGREANATATLQVDLTGVADPPIVTAPEIAGIEDKPVALGLAVQTADTDGSESLSVALSGLPDGARLSAGQDDGDGRWRLPAADLAAVSLTPPHDYSGEFALSIVATATERDGDVAAVDGTVVVKVAAVADAPILTLRDATGREDAAVPLDIAVAVADADGSETLSDLVIDNVPEGAVLSAGQDQGDGRWRLDAGALDGLTLTPPADVSGAIELAVSATAREADGDSAVSLGMVRLGLAGVADMPRLRVTDVAGLEDQVIGLEIAAEPADADGSESLSVLAVEGVPAGAVLSAGQDEGGGRWRLSPDDLAGLTLTPPLHHSGLIELSVAVTAHEADGDSAVARDRVRIALSPVADAPLVSAGDVSGVEDTAVPLDLAAALADDDGSERLTMTIAGLPDGATLSAGAAGGDGRWSLSPDDLAGLTLTPPADFSGMLDLAFIATATEAIGDSAETVADLGIHIRGAADAPRLAVARAAGREDAATPLEIDAGLADTDGSERIAIAILGLPSGARLSAGRQDGDGRWRLSAGDLDGLTLTPPDDLSGAFELQVAASAIEADGDTATTEATLPLRIAAVADAPVLKVGDTAATAAGAIALPMEVALADADGSERLSLTVSGLPTGAILSAGRAAGEGRWRLSAADLPDLVLTPPANSSVPFELTVTAAATEPDGADVAVTWARVTVAPPPPAPRAAATPVTTPVVAPTPRPPSADDPPAETADATRAGEDQTRPVPSARAPETRSTAALERPATMTDAQPARSPLPPTGAEPSAAVAMSTAPALLGGDAAKVEKQPDLSGGGQSTALLIARMMERGDKLMREGDVAGARLLFEFAAKRGSARGATAFAKSHDPSYLDRVGIRGPSTNLERAFEWYTIGAERGDVDATTQIELLKAWLREQAGAKLE